MGDWVVTVLILKDLLSVVCTVTLMTIYIICDGFCSLVLAGFAVLLESGLDLDDTADDGARLLVTGAEETAADAEFRALLVEHLPLLPALQIGFLLGHLPLLLAPSFLRLLGLE